MWPQRGMQWVAAIGLFLATIGIGFAADDAAPFFQLGLVVSAVGLACLVITGWVDFGRKSR